MMKNLLRNSFMLTVLAGSGFAADLTGMWTCETPGRANTPQDIIYMFKQTGNTLTGKLYGDSSTDQQISEGVVTDDTFKFVIRNEGYSGKTTLIFEGELKDGQIHLKRETDNSFTRSDPEARKKSKQEWVLKRVF